MWMRTTEIATKPHAADGTFVIGFKVSPEEYESFMETYEPEKEYQVEFTRYFEKATQGQNKFFHKLLRELSEKMTMQFEQTKEWFVTEYGFPEESGDGYMFVYTDSKDNPPPTFKAGGYYFKAIEDNGEKVKYLAYKGVSMLNSREMNLMIDFLKIECAGQGIKVCSDSEYARIKNNWKDG